jgi:DNA-binding NarL/FixJ family response regulator
VLESRYVLADGSRVKVQLVGRFASSVPDECTRPLRGVPSRQIIEMRAVSYRYSMGVEMGNNHRQRRRISVVVADGSRMGCELLACALKFRTHQFRVVDAVTTLAALLSAVGRHSPEVAVIAIDLEEGNKAGLLALRELHAKFPETGCVMLMDGRSQNLVIDALRAGARGLVFREEPVEQLAECIRSIHSGQLWAGSSELEHIVKALNTAVAVRAVAFDGTNLLSDRQKQLVALVSEGLTNREISQRMSLSEHTVKNYLFRIFDKLGLSSRAELIIYAMHGQDRAT